MHKIPREKTIKNWTAMYWSDHKAQSRVIRGWIRVCMKRLENLWLSGSKIRQVAIPYKFPAHFPVRFLMFHLLFPSFFGYFSCFPRCLSLFPILGLTEKRLPLKKDTASSGSYEIDCVEESFQHALLLILFTRSRFLGKHIESLLELVLTKTCTTVFS